MAKKSNQTLKYLILLLVSVGTVLLSFYFQDQLARLGSWGLLGIFLINIVGSATLFIPAPAIATVLAGGIIYNPLLVAILAALGAAIGDFIAYILGRSGKEVLFKKKSLWYEVFREMFHKRWGAFFILAFSIIPNPFFDAVGIVAGIFSYSPIKFFIYVLLGRFIRNLLIAYFGSLF